MGSTTLKIRLVFATGVLRKTQKKDGLTLSWVLLKPQFETISDVVSYIFHSFQLSRNCPHGIILSMGGFVLPEFESTSILKDKDLISVKRKGSKLIGANKAIEEAETFIEDDLEEKQTLASDVRLLANEEFNKSETDEDKDGDEAVKSKLHVEDSSKRDLASKKRKASSKLQSPKKKRKLQVIVDTVPEEHLHDCKHITKPTKKRKHDNKRNQKALSSPDVKEKSAIDFKPESNSESELSENGNDSIQASAKADKPKKVSRSTLRKRSKRLLKRLQREKAKVDECDGQQPVKDVTADIGSKKDMVPNLVEQHNEDSDAGSDAEGDLVPVMVRPGLIRYLTPGKAKDIQENQEANALDVPSTTNGPSEEHSAPKNASDSRNKQVVKEAHCWNGITNKRIAQKWGQESSTWEESNTSWKDSRDANGHSYSAWTARNQSTSSWQESSENNDQPNNKRADKKHQSNNKSINFDKLLPLIDLPKTGDIIVYRLLELSSSWCPELSSYRVGKIKSFQPDSNKIMLVPVSEYALNLEKNDNGNEKNDDDDEQPLGFSTYDEDGSLETEFSSLNDVRIIKLSDLTQSEATKIVATNGSSDPSTSKTDEAAQDVKKVAPDVNNPVNGKKDVWEEITEAVSAKKAQLMQEDNWTKKETLAKRPWSYRSLRSSAIGPIMARLREQNGV